jgi:LemA protein
VSALLIASLLLLVFPIYAVFAFNRLIRRRNAVDEGWAQIDVELKRRYDLVPNLVEAVRGYRDFEQSVLQRVTEARAEAIAAPSAARDAATAAQAESRLTEALRSLFAVAEAYPDLKAGEQFLALQQQLATTEDRIAYARGYYNATVNAYEQTRTQIPSNVVASHFRFAPREYFEADVSSRAPVAVDLRST